ncbi:ester cyclase [Pedobacter sp. PAMC26386]|nr:ester cyclase [Pedobacter sp. PAMC26386]
MAQPKENLVKALPFSEVKPAKDFIFISGQVGIDSLSSKLVNSTFKADVHLVMKNMEYLFQQCNLGFDDCECNYLPEIMDNYTLTNQIYSTYFKADFPARVCIAVADIPAKANIEIAATALNHRSSSIENKRVIRRFLEEVRSGRSPEQAALFMADTVLAHQLNAEGESTVKRTPSDYTEHVKEFLSLYGNFQFEITELIAEDDKVYARWKQTGRHLGTIDWHPATGKQLIEISSVVYRLEGGKIVEYWIQIDRLGLEKQLK